MKGFSKPINRVVKLQRGTEETGIEVVELVLAPLPLGYHAYVARIYPAPVEYVGGAGAPTAKPIESATYEHGYLTTLILLAKSLGDRVSAKPPARDDRATWDAYAREVLAEFQAAGLVEGDIMLLKRELDRVNAGLSRGNAVAPS